MDRHIALGCRRLPTPTCERREQISEGDSELSREEPKDEVRGNAAES
jgi:hypothetical protein